MTTLRLAGTDDFASIASITNHYITSTAIHFAYDPVTADELRSQWREHQSSYPWLVAVDATRTVLGYAKSGSYRARAAYRWITETGIYLTPTHRGQGLGSLLYTRLLALLRAQGFHSAIGGIALPNDASVRMHERLGFNHVGTIVRAGRKFDRWHDLGFWQLTLQDPEHQPVPLRSPLDVWPTT